MDTVRRKPGRREAARADRSTEVQSTLDRARTLFAGLSKALEAEIRRLEERQAPQAAPGETERASEATPKETADLVRLAQRALATVLEIEAKLMRGGDLAPGQALNLEDARAEVLRRLARLAQ